MLTYVVRVAVTCHVAKSVHLSPFAVYGRCACEMDSSKKVVRSVERKCEIIILPMRDYYSTDGLTGRKRKS